MLGWLVADFVAALLFLAVGYRLMRMPAVPGWVPRALLWPLRRETRRAVRLQGVSALCTGVCFALVPLIATSLEPVAVGGLVAVWAASVLAWAASVWASYQNEPGGARP